MNFEDTVPPRSIQKDVRAGLRGTDQTEWEGNNCSGAHGASHEADLRTRDPPSHATSLSLNPHRDHKKSKQASSQYLLTSQKVQADLICEHKGWMEFFCAARYCLTIACAKNIERAWRSCATFCVGSGKLEATSANATWIE